MAERQLVRYRAPIFDSGRWQGFTLRPDDIIISTPSKSGTTWVQMICALLILQRPVLTKPLSTLSPWLDMLSKARRDVVAELEAQAHRRFIKTHTPLDGLPLDISVTYICMGRDPRDVALSMDNHMANLRFDRFLAARAAAAAIDGIALDPASPPAPSVDGLRERFWAWIDNDAPPTDLSSSLRRTLHHLQTFWDAPPDLNVVMLHYDDLRTDLDGQMRLLAHRLGIAVPDNWPELVRAATFRRMRARADVIAPYADARFWEDNSRFFNRGTSGQWRDLLDAADLERYRARVAAVGKAAVVEWVHRGMP